MSSPELKNKIFEVIKKYPVSSVATINEDKPWVRYMVVQPDENLNLWTTSFANSRKLEQIQKNNNVHVTLGADPQDWHKPYVNVVGKAEILTDKETKKKCWNEMLSEFFSGPEDPNYVVIKISPEKIEYMCADARQPEIYTLG
jgi:general stress protein 26